MKGSKSLTIVIKLGTSSIVDEKTHEPWLSNLALIVETACNLRKDGHRVVLVSSGAIGIALPLMGFDKRPKPLPQVQALAAIGQGRLMSLWERLFDYRNQPVAQVLLTRNDIADRTQYINAQNTFTELLRMGVIPIVNENDTLAVTEIKFGDNDTLSAITAAMVQADYLFLMTDVDCLYTANPRTHPDATAIEVVSDISSLAVDVSSAGSALGTGGMSTKLVAARLATSAGVTTVITRASQPGNVFQIVSYLQAVKALPILTPATSSSGSPPATGAAVAAPFPSLATPSTFSSPTATGVGTPQSSAESSSVLLLPPLHTRFLPAAAPIRDRPFWLLHGLAPHGTVYIDQGAYRALRRKAGLLPAGVVDVEGHFAQQEAVRLVVVSRGEHERNGGSGDSSKRSSDYFDSVDHAAATPNATTAPTPGTPKAALTSGGLGGYEGACAAPDGPAPAPNTSSTTLASRPATPNRLASTPRPSTPNRGAHHHHPSHRHSRHSSTVPPSVLYPDASEVGRALVTYSSAEIARIKGCQSGEISALLGYAESEYVALRENVSLLGGGGGEFDEERSLVPKDS